MTASGSSISTPAVEVKSLTKSFGGRLALKGVDLVVREGEFLTILGPNGAGKTTLLQILATVSRASSGKIRIGGLEVGKESTEIRRRIGYVSHQTLLFDDLTAYENLKFYARMYDVPDLDRRIHSLAEKMELSSQLHQLVRTLSRGMQQRLSIVRALLHDPSVLLLDEPETGLDQRATAMLGEVLDAGARTVIMSSHHLERGLELGDRVVILASGRITYEESKESLDLANFTSVYSHYTEAR